MANKIQVKRSSVPAKVPATTDLDLGEIAINTYDGKMYIKKDDGTPAIVQIGGGGAGTGDVVGPASATDNAIARYDGTTGKLIQNSSVTLDDNGNIQNLNGIAFDTTPTSAPTAAGSMFWDSGNGAPTVVLNANTSLQLGQENIALVYNGTGSTIANGSVVAVSGAQGQRPSVVLADADSEALSAGTLGIATQDIANGAEGFVCTFGLVRGLDTSGFTSGAPIYLSQTAGAFTATRPAAPAHTVFLGWVIFVSATAGEVFVHISNGWELDELHNVLITSPASGNTLIYDATAGVWKNANLTDGTGITITEGAGSITIANAGVTSAAAGTGIFVSNSTGAVTITNTAPDQTVALTGSGATTVTGTYPNFTISSTNTTYSAATSTTLGLIELGSDTVQSTAANAVTSTASRTYALQVNAAGQAVVNVPWTDTNSGGTVTSVGGTGSVNGITLSGTVTSSGNLTLGGTLSNVSLTSQVTGTLPAGNGGTAQSTWTTGDLLYASGTNTLAKRAIGTTGQVLTVSGGVPTWATPSGGTGTVTSVAAGAGMNFTTITGTGTVTMGTPSTLTTSTTNSASGTTHTHAVTFPVTSVAGKTGAVTLANTDISGLGTMSTQAASSVAITGGTVGINSGSASSPSLFRSGDTNCGIYFPSTDTFAVTTSGTERFRVGSTGVMLYGTTTTDPYTFTSGSGISIVGSEIQVAGQIAVNKPASGGGDVMKFFTQGAQKGSIVTSSTNTTYNTTSDYRLKENVVPIANSVDLIKQLKPCQFNWKETGEQSLGFIAHELQAVIPDAVNGEKDAVEEDGKPKYQGIDTSFIVAPLVAALQDAIKRIEELEQKLANS